MSIDRSEDRTDEICRSVASQDPRLEVFFHDERLGWAHNLNFLLDKVETEYFFIYFHDDIIDQRYVEVLLARLEGRFDAASAQADTLHVDPRGYQRVNAGRPQEGTTAERVIASLVDAHMGSPLRALIRTELARPAVRFPATSMNGFAGHIPFTAALLAAGPVLHVPEVLYWRPDKRQGGLVDAWKSVPIEELLEDHRANADQTLEMIDASEANPAEQMAMRFALCLSLMKSLRQREIGAGVASLAEPTSVAASFDFGGLPPEIFEVSGRPRRAILAAHVNLIRLELLHAAIHKNPASALSAAKQIGWWDVLLGVPELGRQYFDVLRQRFLPSEVPAELQRWERED